MKLSKFLARVACVAITAFGCSSPPDESGKGSVMDTTTTKAANEKTEISVSLPGKHHAGEAITCVVSLKNNDKDDLFYGHTTEYKDFKVTVYDSQGKPVPFTRRGEEELSEAEDAPRFKYIVEKLAPGAILQHSYNLSSLFDLTVAGKYTVVVSMKLNPNIRGKNSQEEVSYENAKVLSVCCVPNSRRVWLLVLFG
jgi:hypothetical protein